MYQTVECVSCMSEAADGVTVWPQPYCRHWGASVLCALSVLPHACAYGCRAVPKDGEGLGTLGQQYARMYGRLNLTLPLHPRH